MNSVIGGDYKGSVINITITGKVYINCFKLFKGNEKIMLNKNNVAEYNIIDQNEKTKMGSGIIRSAVGGAVFGVPGALAGAVSAQKKKSHIIDIWFRDGKKSTIEIDNNIFKYFLGAL